MNDNLLSPTHPDAVAWSRNHFRTLRDGGSWGMPRSGLLFVKRGEELHLKLRMPHDPKMPCTAEQLREQQDADFEAVKTSFGLAGITVVNKAPPL